MRLGIEVMAEKATCWIIFKASVNVWMEPNAVEFSISAGNEKREK